MKTVLFLIIAAASLSTASCVPVLVAAGGVGAADVGLFHGCIGVHLANVMPWNYGDQRSCARR